MSRAGRKTKRRRNGTPQAIDTGAVFVEYLKRRLLHPDPRSHAKFLQDLGSKQAAGRLANPATVALLDRLERANAS